MIKKTSKTTLNLRIDSSLKENAEKVISDLGISMSAAVVLFLKATIREKGLPFSVKAHSKEKTTHKQETSDFLRLKPSKKTLKLPGSTSLKNAINKL